VTAVILTWVTSAPSAALRLTTSPDDVCALTTVEALVIAGVSATGATVMVAVVDAPVPPPAASVAPCTTIEDVPK